jgi:hypothetical protein
MKKLYSGKLVLDRIDIVLISYTIGYSLSYVIRKYNNNKKRTLDPSLDPIINELKGKCRVVAVCIDGTPYVPTMRGGGDGEQEVIKGFSLIIKNKRLAAIAVHIINIRRRQKLFEFIQLNLSFLNSLLSTNLGIHLCSGGNSSYIEIILLILPSSIGGFIMDQILKQNVPLVGLFIPIAIFYGREVEIIHDPAAKCRVLCQAAAEYHNKKYAIEMQQTVLENIPKINIFESFESEFPFLCVEDRLSLLQRFKLRSNNFKNQKQVTYFRDFIKKFPECQANARAVYEEIFAKTDIDSEIAEMLIEKALKN